MWKNCLECDRKWVFLGGIAAALVGGKILKSKKTRERCGTGHEAAQRRTGYFRKHQRRSRRHLL